MSIPELTQQRLAQLCETRKIPRFSCEEMVELLEDGEEVAWILEQALPDGPSDVAGELGAILAMHCRKSLVMKLVSLKFIDIDPR